MWHSLLSFERDGDIVNLPFKFLTTKEITAYGIIGSIGAYAFGGWSQLIILLLIANAIDYVTGVAASIKEGKGLNSDTHFWGLFKKGLLLLMVFFAHRIDIALEINYVMNAAIYFYLVNELLSIVENYGRLQMPLPDVIKNIIAVLKNKEAGK